MRNYSTMSLWSLRSSLRSSGQRTGSGVPDASAQDERLGFTRSQSEIQRNIFIPKYYDPAIPARLDELTLTHRLTTLTDLQENGEVELEFGDDIGKMTYGGRLS